MIELRDVRKRFGAHEVLRGVTLRVRPGEILYIIGTSGVGKSVTIKHIIGLIRPDAGEILLDGEPIHDLSERAFYAVRRRVAMVFQHATLLDALTVAENVALPLRKHHRLDDGAARERALSLLAQVGMERFADRMPAALGDGLRKRVAIARALALEPAYVLFDEPTTGLDPVSARRVDRLIAALRPRGVGAAVVSHDLASIFGVADRIAFIYRGVVHASGTPREIRQSGDPVVQQFIQGRSDGPMETPGF